MYRLSWSSREKPTKKVYIQSFNDKFRDECLNEHWFHSLAHVRTIFNMAIGLQ
jgi:putative transposase